MMISKSNPIKSPINPALSRILIIGPAWVGDMVMAQALFKYLKQQNPAVLIDVLAAPWVLPLLKKMPEVHEAILLPFQHGEFGLGKRYQMGKVLRVRCYQQAIVLPNSWKSALIPFFAKIPVRTGWRGEWRYSVLNDIRTLDPKKYPLMVQRFVVLGCRSLEEMDHLETYALPELVVRPEAIHQTLQKYSFASEQLKKPILALCPGAEYGPSKRWPETYFAEIAQVYLDKGWQVWLLGSKKDIPISAQIQALTQNRCTDWTGQTELSEAVDLLSLVKIVVTNDSGLMHIAAALGKFEVVLYGSTSTQFTPPLTRHAQMLVAENVSCRPCYKRECPLKHHRCMVDIRPERVVNIIDNV
jgi:heptosyltransferase II